MALKNGQKIRKMRFSLQRAGIGESFRIYLVGLKPRSSAELRLWAAPRHMIHTTKLTHNIHHTYTAQVK